MPSKESSTYTGIYLHVLANKSTFKNLYIDQNMTAKEVAANQGMEYSEKFQKVLLRICGKKGLGLGGKRSGSGMKKGTKLCVTCRRKLINCKCSDEKKE